MIEKCFAKKFLYFFAVGIIANASFVIAEVAKPIPQLPAEVKSASDNEAAAKNQAKESSSTKAEDNAASSGAKPASDNEVAAKNQAKENSSNKAENRASPVAIGLKQQEPKKSSEAALAKKTEDNAASSKKVVYTRSQYYGEPVYDEQGMLKYIKENSVQAHSQEEFVWIRVKNIKPRNGGKEIGRIRVAAWDKPDNYGKEGINPFRACSYWAKDTVSNEMVFKIGGLTRGHQYSFFAHHDKNDSGIVTRNFLRIPIEPYIFSNTKNQGRGPGLKREGLSPPQYKNTLVKYEKPGQEIVLSF